MTELKKFEQDGNQFTMKKQYGFGLLIVFGMLAFTIGGIYYKNSAVIWIFGIMTVLCSIAIWSQRFVIDLDEKSFIIKNGLINKPVEIPLSDIVNFEMVKMKQYLITTNVSLNLYYIKNDKEKCTGIAQGFTTKSMQVIMNEINAILRINEHSGKI